MVGCTTMANKNVKGVKPNDQYGSFFISVPKTSMGLPYCSLAHGWAVLHLRGCHTWHPCREYLVFSRRLNQLSTMQSSYQLLSLLQDVNKKLGENCRIWSAVSKGWFPAVEGDIIIPKWNTKMKRESCDGFRQNRQGRQNGMVPYSWSILSLTSFGAPNELDTPTNTGQNRSLANSGDDGEICSTSSPYR